VLKHKGFLVYRRWGFILLATLALSVSAQAQPPAADGITALESVASRFATLEAFLKNRDARKEYEAALARYFGRDKFPCDGFQEVIDQVRRWMDVDPSVAERLWAPQKAWRHEVMWKRASAKSPERYRFASLPRRFHGIWLDLSRAGCTEGECAPLSLGAPGRWAAALEGSAVFHLEKGARYTGTSLLVVDVEEGARRLKLVATTADGLLHERTGKKKGTLLEEWAKMVKTKAPLAFVNREEKVTAILDKRTLASVTGLSFRDTHAKSLMAVLPGSCLKAEKTAKAKVLVPGEGEDSSPTTAQGSSSSGIFSSTGLNLPPAPTAALGDIMITLNLPPAPAADPIQNKAVIEKGLGEKLQKAPDAKQRALAALALDILGQATAKPETQKATAPGRKPRARVPSYLDNFSKPTRTALNQALKDPSPAVRSHAALTIADAGGTRFPTYGKPLPRELQSIQAPLASGLKATYAAPQAAFVQVPPSAQGYASPEVLRDRAQAQSFRQGFPDTPKETDERWKAIREAPNPEKEKVEYVKEAMDFLNTNRPEPVAKKIEGLKETVARLALNEHELQKLGTVTEGLVPDFCKQCLEDRRNGILLPQETEASNSGENR
jgi:hypothetical protein